MILLVTIIVTNDSDHVGDYGHNRDNVSAGDCLALVPQMAMAEVPILEGSE